MPDVDAIPTALLPPAPPESIATPLVGGRYRIMREIGGGGMGVVFAAEDVTSGRPVALKVLSQSRSGWDGLVRFHREARVAASASTRHVVQVLDAGSDAASSRHYLVMELLMGDDASQLAVRHGPIAQHVALRIAIQACAGLACAHGGGTIHRDIKPANLFLSREEDEIVVKVLDFGAAKVSHDIGPALTSPGTLIGSPHYMSPEQARGAARIDHRTDIWGLGVVLYKLLSGRCPFEDETSFGGLLFKIVSESPPELRSVAPWIRPEVAEAVHRALSRDPDERYESATAMAYALLPLAGGTAVLRPDELPRRFGERGDTIPCSA